MKTPKQNNQEQLDELIFSLSERINPTLVWITIDSPVAIRQTYLKLKKVFKNYKFIDIDISSERGTSLVQMLNKNLPKQVLFSKEIKHFVNVFGLDSLIGGFGVQQIIHEINFERDILFKDFPCVIIIWSNKISENKVKNNAGDFWDWLTNHYSFSKETERSEIKIFIDYSHNDAEDCNELIGYLKKSEIHDHFEIWRDTEIKTGEQWYETMKSHITYADIIIILLSPHYLNSPISLIELTEKLVIAHNEGKKIVLPVLLRDCQWRDTNLSQLQVLPTNTYPIYSSFWENKKEAYENVIKVIINAVNYRYLNVYSIPSS